MEMLKDEVGWQLPGIAVINASKLFAYGIVKLS
jgi:hypothetical protein